MVAEVGQIDRVRLHSRPVWESLLVGALASLGLLLAPGVWRAGFAGLVLLSLAACFLQRRYALVVILLDGNTRAIDLGVGTRRSPLVQRIDSVWESLRPALEELGIKS